MKKSLVLLLATVLVFVFSGCSKNDGTEFDTSIAAGMERHDYTDGTMSLFYTANIDDLGGQKIAGKSEVSVKGPTGTTTLAEISPGFFSFSFTGSETAAHFVPGETYTFTVTRPKAVHTGTIVAPGGVSYDAGGNTVTWQYGDDGYADVLKLGGSSSHRYFTGTTPRTIWLLNDGCYDSGSGTYLVQLNTSAATYTGFENLYTHGTGLGATYKKDFYVIK
jgi:hypothetical protein